MKAPWTTQEEKRDRLTQEALADVDKDRVVDHITVQTWAESLSTDTTEESVPTLRVGKSRPLKTDL